MQALIILAIGITIVIGGILTLRLHAFVALVLGGLAVAILTPPDFIERSSQLENSSPAMEIQRDGDSWTVVSSDPNLTSAVLLQETAQGTPLTRVGELSLPEGGGQSAGGDGVRLIVTGSGDEVSESAALRIISHKQLANAGELRSHSFIARVTSTLGEYCGKLAILIVAASIIGRCLLDSGAADRIVTATLSFVGERLAPAAFVASGFLLGIPVFFDTVFYLMIPLGKAMRLRTGGNYLLYVLSIVAGGTMAHSLVPPTPGPLLIAEQFEVPIGSMIVGGTLVGLFSASIGMIYAFWINRRCELPLRDFDETSAVASASDGRAPSLMASLTPIALPVLLITGGALLTKEADGSYMVAGMPTSSTVATVIKNLSNKNLALLISAGFAVVMYVRTKQPTKQQLADSLQLAVSSAGTIILVTAAGGAFGRMMKQTSVAELLRDLPGTSPVMIVIAAFLVTTAVRTAQGSATVAMITAAGIFSGIVAGGAAGVDPLYVALAVGCGSKPIAWMNDSGFWVITRMSGMTETEGLRYITPMTALAGVAGLVAVIIGVTVFP